VDEVDEGEQADVEVEFDEEPDEHVVLEFFDLSFEVPNASKSVETGRHTF